MKVRKVINHVKFRDENSEKEGNNASRWVHILTNIRGFEFDLTGNYCAFSSNNSHKIYIWAVAHLIAPALLLDVANHFQSATIVCSHICWSSDSTQIAAIYSSTCPSIESYIISWEVSSQKQNFITR